MAGQNNLLFSMQEGFYLNSSSIQMSVIQIQCVQLKCCFSTKDPSQDSSIGSISGWYRGGPGFKSRQGR